MQSVANNPLSAWFVNILNNNTRILKFCRKNRIENIDDPGFVLFLKKNIKSRGYTNFIHTFSSVQALATFDITNRKIFSRQLRLINKRLVKKTPQKKKNQKKNTETTN